MKGLLIRKNISLKGKTTFRIGGKARFFVKIQNKDQFRQAFEFAKKRDLPIFVLGGGSDILVSDKGFLGLVIQFQNKTIDFYSENHSVLVTVGAGAIWDDLVKKAVKGNLQGIECLSGIPGSVGGAPVQNIGAYGQELQDTFVRVSVFDTEKLKVLTMNKKDCKFSYRESIFKKQKERFVILDVTLRLKKGGRPTTTYESFIYYLKEKGIDNPSLSQVREAVLDIRRERLEDYRKCANAGSFFKNPIIDKKSFEKISKRYPEMPSFPADAGKVKLFAGWLIENAGWKGKKYKNVGVSQKNALILVNPEGKGKASEIKELAQLIQRDVKKKFGIILQPEVQFIGF